MPVLYLDYSPHELEGLPGKGISNPKFALVGIAPSTKRPENRRLEPFGSKSWSLIKKITRMAEGDFYVTNLVKTPLEPRKKVPLRLVRQWAPVLYEELSNIKPGRILAVGSEPAKILCPGFKSLSEDHGAFFFNESLNCYVIPTFHFAVAGSNPDYAKIVARDLERFFNVQPTEVPTATLFSSVDQLPEKLQGDVIIDIETTGLTLADRITKIGLNWGSQYWIMENPTQHDVHQLGEFLYYNGKVVIGHNIAFDSYMLSGHDFSPENNFWTQLTYKDTMLLAHNTGQHSSLRLKHLITMCTDHPGSHSQGSFEDNAYLVSDLMGTKALAELYAQQYHVYSGRLMSDMAGVFGVLRSRGVYINLKTLAEIAVPLNIQHKELAHELLAYRDINWRSSAQVAQALVEEGVPLEEKTQGGQFAVGEPVLLPFAEEHDIVKVLLEYKALDKLLSGFVDPYLETQSQFTYPSLLIHGTTTGRLSCKEPNLQQIPRKGPFKQIFQSRWHAEGGMYGLVDLSQAELRVAALLSGDEVFASVLQDQDAHRYIASMAFAKPQEEISATERKASKAITFGLLYGGSTGGLAKRSGLPKARVEQVLKTFFKVFPKLNLWIENFREQSEYITGVTTAFGRHRDLQMVRHYESSNGVFRKAINTPVQSAASDIMLTVIRATYRGLVAANLKTKPLFAVHDSMLLEIYPGELDGVILAVQDGFRSLKETPLANYKLFNSLPFLGEIVVGSNWARCESTSDFYDKDAPHYPVSSLE